MFGSVSQSVLWSIHLILILIITFPIKWKMIKHCVASCVHSFGRMPTHQLQCHPHRQNTFPTYYTHRQCQWVMKTMRHHLSTTPPKIFIFLSYFSHRWGQRVLFSCWLVGGGWVDEARNVWVAWQYKNALFVECLCCVSVGDDVGLIAVYNEICCVWVCLNLLMMMCYWWMVVAMQILYYHDDWF